METKTLRKRENPIHVSHKMKTYFYYYCDSKFLESYHVCRIPHAYVYSMY